MEPLSPKTRSKKFQQEKGGNSREGDTVRFEENEISRGQPCLEENTTKGDDGGEYGLNNENNENGNGEDEAGDEEEGDEYAPLPLSGFRVYIIHVKDALSDEPCPREKILEELRAHGKQAGLGCEFYAPECGEWAFV